MQHFFYHGIVIYKVSFHLITLLSTTNSMFCGTKGVLNCKAIGV